MAYQFIILDEIFDAAALIFTKFEIQCKGNKGSRYDSLKPEPRILYTYFPNNHERYSLSRCWAVSFQKKDSLEFQNILKKAEICITVPRDMLRQREFFPLCGKHTGNNDHQ